MVKAGLRHGYLLVLFIIFSFVMNEVVIIGNDLIAKATDTMLSGGRVYFSRFIVPLLVMVAVGTAAAYLKSICGSHYSAAVQKDVRISLGRHLLRLPFPYFDDMDERTQKAYDAIQGIVVGRSYNLYELHKQKIDTVIDNMVAQACKSTRISSLGWVLKNVITTIPVIFCYLFALYETGRGKITVGEMLAFTVILSRILYPIGDIVFCANDIREVGVSLKRIQEIYNCPEEKKGGSIILHNETEIRREVPAIEWKDIDFGYGDGKGRRILNKISFSVETGEQTAFVGGSGEGKTTIFKLLCGLYEKEGGQYKLFGHSFEDWNLEAARSCFSEVSQNVFLFPETIRQNVACGKENATDEEIVEACRNANIHDFIMQLPKGYETLVGERGVLLSGGQRQRISIARAFLKNAPILLLDEPTASVDIEGEQKIQDAIERIAKGRTVIIIAHRLSTVKNAKRIYVVSGGKIAETGNHAELLAKQGIYAEMYAKG